MQNFSDGFISINVKDIFAARSKRELLKIEMKLKDRHNKKLQTNNGRKHSDIPMRRYNQYLKI